MTSVSIQAFGCRVNQAEAFAWATEFGRRGLALERDGCGSVIVVNTCTLTARADRDVRRYLRKVVRDNPEARVVVTGCLAERDPEGLAALPGVWKVVPNSAKAALPDAVLAGGESSGTSPAGPAAGGIPAGPRPFRMRAPLKIQDGCDMACRFCIIPRVRGASRSVPAEEVLRRVRELAGQGFREIVLTGIHLCAYGKEACPRTSLLDLLAEVEEQPGNFRIRLSSLDPRLLPENLVDFLARSRRICPHFHLSLQHGSDRVLRAMGRSSTAGEYRSLLADIAGRVPDAALGADMIVGYPDETEADFEAARALIEETDLSYVHVFVFSPRPGTKAAEGRPVDRAVAARRASRLRSLSNAKSRRFRSRFIGRVLDGVVIKRLPSGGEVLTGNALDVAVPIGLGPAEGAAVRVRISGITGRGALGEIVG
jgi:threonylcarbamoyladenosine tRNA methylthiotransferase MtaB